MSDIKKGYDRYTMSTPVQVRRGSACVLRRCCQILDEDTLRESILDISAATEIYWEVTADFDDDAGAILSKDLGAGIALVAGGTTGQYDITLTAGDTSGLLPGSYFAAVAITLPGGFYKFKSYHFMILAAPPLGE